MANARQINCRCQCQMLKRIAEQLQLYKPTSFNEESKKKYLDIGSNIEECCCVNWRLRRAAVLICLFEGHEGELRVILTKRSMKLSSYPAQQLYFFEETGDVALPGGKTEEGDADDSATALREAMEEIGLHPQIVQVVANLEPFDSPNQLSVVPVIGLLSTIEDFKPAPNPDEVDAIFDAPLEMFLKAENQRLEEREWMGCKYIVHHFDFETSKQGVYPICGLTASILIRAASVIFQRSPCFNQQHLPDFQQLEKAFNNLA